jgi:hypothetical protein
VLNTHLLIAEANSQHRGREENVKHETVHQALQVDHGIGADGQADRRGRGSRRGS